MVGSGRGQGARRRPGAKDSLVGAHGVSVKWDFPARSADADIRLDDRYASGIHARVFNRSGAYFVEDMNSTNGTLLNGATLQGEAELVDRDTIQIGDTIFRFEVG